MHIKFHNEYFKHSKVDKGGSQLHRQSFDSISLLLFLQNTESGLKTKASSTIILYIASIGTNLMSQTKAERMLRSRGNNMTRTIFSPTDI
jgi:hypothetical protein